MEEKPWFPLQLTQAPMTVVVFKVGEPKWWISSQSI